jgi:predicted cytidylate kinase
MGMRRIICISGDLASGKSAAGKLVAAKLGYEFFSSGDMFRQLAGKRDVDVLKYNKISETDPDIDGLIDGTIADMGVSHESMVFDSRMAWYFVKDCFRVYLSIDEQEAAKRVFLDRERSGEKYGSIPEAMEGLLQRRKAERERYKSKYGVDICDLGNYHLVIDTAGHTSEQVAGLIIDRYNICLSGE